MKIYLKELDGSWKLYEGELKLELKLELEKRGIQIHPTATIGEGVYIGARVYIGEGASIGERATIGEGASIREGASIGEGASIRECATICERATIGEGVYIGERATILEEVQLLSQYDCVTIGGLGSREATLTAYRNKKTIFINTGCFAGSLNRFLARVAQTHRGNEHERQYRMAVAYIKTRFATLSKKGRK